MEIHLFMDHLVAILNGIQMTIQIDSANQEAGTMLALKPGWFRLPFADGSYTKILMLYCLQLKNTISP